MDLQIKLSTLAATLREDRDKLLTQWLSTLRVGMEKPGAVLTDIELRDHFAELLEDLCNQLEVPLTEASEISALKHAENHGDARWAQGYRLPELIRELAALRTVVIAAVVAHGHTRLSLHEQSLANIIVHRFFDALVVESATFFVNLSEEAAVLQVRQHLAEELHDSACQTLNGAVLQLAAISRKLDPAISEQLNAVSKTFREGIEDIRIIVHGLSPIVRHFEHGLPLALKELGAELSRLVCCEVSCDTNVDISSKHSFHLYRIAQEAAGNACKHAQPKTISITLAETADAFELRVCDDGCGFEPTAPTTSGIGLHNMQQRARAIGALLKISSKPGVGTTITCILDKAGPMGME